MYRYLLFGALQYNLVCENQSTGCRDISWMKFVTDTFFEIANSFHVELSKPTKFFPTRYFDNAQDLNSVLDLVFFMSKFNRT